MAATGRIEPPDWMTAPETLDVVQALTADGTEVRFVGGCVRDALAERRVKDIDLATPDPPETVIRLLESSGLKAIPTGLAHGTVTALSGERSFEITTLREDVETDGRHARVAFTDDWVADAARRDFTMNALSCRPDGSYFDPFGGATDLAAGRVQFVGDPRARIAEDYLRLLRFFRFHAHYGRGAPDPTGLAAAAELAPRIDRLSGERIRDELFKLLMASEAVPVIEVMAERSILNAVLPSLAGVASLARLIVAERRHGGADPLRRLASLLPRDRSIAAAAADRLKLSNAARLRLDSLADPNSAVALGTSARDLRVILYRLGQSAVEDLLLLSWARSTSAPDEDLDRGFEVVEAWSAPEFPVSGRDVMDLGLESGPKVGEALEALEDWWIEADFQPDRAACLGRLESLVQAAQRSNP